MAPRSRRADCWTIGWVCWGSPSTTAPTAATSSTGSCRKDIFWHIFICVMYKEMLQKLIFEALTDITSIIWLKLNDQWVTVFTPQAKLYNFLERPTTRGATIYHALVWVASSYWMKVHRIVRTRYLLSHFGPLWILPYCIPTREVNILRPKSVLYFLTKTNCTENIKRQVLDDACLRIVVGQAGAKKVRIFWSFRCSDIRLRPWEKRGRKPLWAQLSCAS